MEKILSRVDDQTGQIEIKLSFEDLQPYYDKGFKEAQATVEIKGFRKGKVPMTMIKKMFGKQIEAEAAENALNETINNIFDENHISVLATPVVEKMDPIDNGFDVLIKYKTTPDFELKDYRGLVIDEPIHVVTDEEINEKIEKISYNSQDLEPAEQVENDKFLVSISLRPVDQNTHEIIDGQEPQDTKLFLFDEHIIPDLKNSIINTKVGDTFIFTQNNKEAESDVFLIEIKEIQRVIPKEVNDEFIRQYTNNQEMTLEDFKEELGFQLQDNWDRRSREILENSIIEKIINDYDFIPPEELVERTVKIMIDDMANHYKKQGVDIPRDTDGSLKQQLVPQAKRVVKWHLIKDKIVEKENITVEDFDIDEYIEMNFKDLQIDKDKIKEIIGNNKQMLDTILNKKLMNLILDFAITNEVTFDGQEFNPDESIYEDHVCDENCDHDHK